MLFINRGSQEHVNVFKSPGGDGIIRKFYHLYEKDFLEFVKERFLNLEPSDAQYNGMITLLHKSEGRDGVCILLNTDYKIISKLLTNRKKPVLRKTIYLDQKVVSVFVDEK